jgi:thiamine-phosphate pyrophosphorylase
MTFTYLARQAHALKQQHWPQHPIPSLVFITEHARIPNPSEIISKLPAHSLVLIRDYDHPKRRMYAEDIANCCKHYHHPFLVAGDIALAYSTQAAGIHLPEYRMNESITIKQQFPNWWITSSAHNTNAILEANRLPLSALFVSPIFPTSSHLGANTLGIEGLNSLISLSSHPVLALGGIKLDTCKLLQNSKLLGLGSITAYL